MGGLANGLAIRHGGAASFYGPELAALARHEDPRRLPQRRSMAARCCALVHPDFRGLFIGLRAARAERVGNGGLRIGVPKTKSDRNEVFLMRGRALVELKTPQEEETRGAASWRTKEETATCV